MDEKHVGDVVDSEAVVAIEFVVVVNKMSMQRCGIRFSESNNQKSTTTIPADLLTSQPILRFRILRNPNSGITNDQIQPLLLPPKRLLETFSERFDGGEVSQVKLVVDDFPLSGPLSVGVRRGRGGGEGGFGVRFGLLAVCGGGRDEVDCQVRNWRQIRGMMRGLKRREVTGGGFVARYDI